MTGSKSDYLENALLNHVLGGPDYTRPTTVYVALFTTAPSDAGGGVEVSGGNYIRKGVVNNATNWPAASDGAKSNGTEITFAEATAAWGELKAFAIFDADVTGNMLYWADLTTPKTIGSGDTAKFAVGSLVLLED